MLRPFMTLISYTLLQNGYVGLANSQKDPPGLLPGIHKTLESVGVPSGRATFQVAVTRVLGPRRDCFTHHRGDKCLTQNRLTHGTLKGWPLALWDFSEPYEEGEVGRVEHQVDSGCGMLEERVRRKRWPGRSLWGLPLGPAAWRVSSRSGSDACRARDSSDASSSFVP